MDLKFWEIIFIRCFYWGENHEAFRAMLKVLYYAFDFHNVGFGDIFEGLKQVM